MLTFTAGADGRGAGSGAVRFRGTDSVAVAAPADGDHIVALRDSAGVVACGALPALTAPAIPAGLPATGGGGGRDQGALPGLLAAAALGPVGLALALARRRTTLRTHR